MKKLITTFLSMITTFHVCADAPIVLEVSPKMLLPTSSPDAELNNSYLYLRMTALDTNPQVVTSAVPGLGIGYRVASGKNGMFDFSANYSQGSGWSDKKLLHKMSLPEVAYLHYFNPTRSASLYAGGGFGWGYLSKRVRDEEHPTQKQYFHGLLSSATVGCELLRKTNRRAFTEFSVTLPAVAARTRGDFIGPYYALSVGAGL